MRMYIAGWSWDGEDEIFIRLSPANDTWANAILKYLPCSSNRFYRMQKDGWFWSNFHHSWWRPTTQGRYETLDNAPFPNAPQFHFDEHQVPTNAYARQFAAAQGLDWIPRLRDEHIDYRTE